MYLGIGHGLTYYAMSWRGPSNSLQFRDSSGNSIPRCARESFAVFKTGVAVPDPVDNNIIWSTGTGSGSIGGTVTRFDESTHPDREGEGWAGYWAAPPGA